MIWVIAVLIAILAAEVARRSYKQRHCEHVWEADPGVWRTYCRKCGYETWMSIEEEQ